MPANDGGGSREQGEKGMREDRRTAGLYNFKFPLFSGC